MFFLLKLKPLLIVLSAIILLSGCSINDNDSRKESENTQVNQTDSLSNQAKDTKESESKLFGILNNYKIENPETYYDDKYNFSVDYPSDWEVAKPDSKIDTVSPDGSPEQGINISVDNKEFFDAEKNRYFNSLYVYHFVSHIYVSNFEDNLTQEVFTTDEGVNGQIHYDKRDGYLYIYLTLGEGSFYGAQINISEALFEKHKGQIYGILKSVKIPND